MTAAAVPSGEIARRPTCSLDLGAKIVETAEAVPPAATSYFQIFPESIQ